MKRLSPCLRCVPSAPPRRKLTRQSGPNQCSAEAAQPGPDPWWTHAAGAARHRPPMTPVSGDVVLDASLSCAWCFADEAQAQVPSLWRWEISNVLVQAKRNGSGRSGRHPARCCGSGPTATPSACASSSCEPPPGTRTLPPGSALQPGLVLHQVPGGHETRALAGSAEADIGPLDLLLRGAGGVER